MKSKILLLDQNPEIVAAYTEQFGDVYQVVSDSLENFDIESFRDPQTYLAFVITFTDTSSPNYSLLSSIAEQYPSIAPSIIALTETDTESTFINCYELGVGLCIPTYRSPDVIAKKSTQLIDYKNQVNQLAIEEVKLSDLVNTTMMQSSFYGASLDLISELQFAATPESMANYIFDFMQRFGIYTSIFFHVPNGHVDFEQQNFYCSPLETQVFELLCNKGRIYEFGHRVMFNAPCVSILIKNMPEKDSVNYGLFIDVFAKLVPSVDISFNNLLNKQQLRETQTKLVQAVEDIQHALLRSQQDRQMLLDKLVLEIGLSFHEYEFTDQQEEFLTNIIEKNVVKQTKSSEEFLEISEKLSSLTKTLTDKYDATASEYFEENQDNQSSNDIELF